MAVTKTAEEKSVSSTRAMVTLKDGKGWHEGETYKRGPGELRKCPRDYQEGENDGIR